MKNNLVLVLVAFVVGAVSFIGGGLYVGSVWDMNDPFKLQTKGKGETVTGTPLETVAGGFIIAAQDGRTKKILVSDRTLFEKSQRMTFDQFVAAQSRSGTLVQVSGSVDQEGNITASAVRMLEAPAGGGAVPPQQ